MPKVTVKQQILFILNQKKEWIVKQDVVDTLMNGYKFRDKKITSGYIGRRLRKMSQIPCELTEDGEPLIDVDYRGKKNVAWYAPLKTEKPKEYKTIHEIITNPDGTRSAVPKRIEV